MRIKKTVESLVAAVTSTDVAAIERELTKLEGRRAQLAESLDAATHNAIDASAVRRELIIDNRDQQTLEEANAKVREAEERRVALDDALRTLDQKIAETTKRLEEAKDKAERDRIAQVLEQEADAVEKASLAVDKAAKQFASAYRQLRAMSPASCLRTPDRHRLAEDRVAALLAAEALAGAIPNLFIHKPDELGIASVLYRAFPLGDDVVRDVTRDQQQLDNPPGLVITPRFSSRHVCAPRPMPFAPAMSLLFFPLRRQNRCGISDDVLLSATSCSCSRCDTPTDSVSPSCTTPGRLVCRRR